MTVHFIQENLLQAKDFQNHHGKLAGNMNYLVIELTLSTILTGMVVNLYDCMYILYL